MPPFLEEKIMRKKIAMMVVALASLLVAAPAFAGAPTNAVKTQQAKLFKTIAKPRTAAQQAKLRKQFDKMLSYSHFARGSMGKKWAGLEQAQQERFSGLLTQLVRRNYKRNLKKLLDFDIQYVGEKGDTVMTNAVHKTDKREPPISINFTIAKVNGSYKIIDIITEGASLVKTYRSQFLRIWRKKGFDKLIQLMEKKLKKSS